MIRHVEGAPGVKLPYRVLVHMVAARYGQTPDAVRMWPADDFFDALNFMSVTEPQAHVE